MLVLLFCAILNADTLKLADSKPSIQNPRKVIFQLLTSDERMAASVVNYIYNLQKAYCASYVMFAVVAQADGIVFLIKKSPLKERIEALIQSDVDFLACENTMETKKLTKTDMLEGISYAKSGMQEIVERKLSGWVYLTP
jgi:hypothetical protein